jgi:hypothetical protein
VLFLPVLDFLAVRRLVPDVVPSDRITPDVPVLIGSAFDLVSSGGTLPDLVPSDRITPDVPVLIGSAFDLVSSGGTLPDLVPSDRITPDVPVLIGFAIDLASRVLLLLVVIGTADGRASAASRRPFSPGLCLVPLFDTIRLAPANLVLTETGLILAFLTLLRGDFRPLGRPIPIDGPV